MSLVDFAQAHSSKRHLMTRGETRFPLLFTAIAVYYRILPDQIERCFSSRTFEASRGRRHSGVLYIHPGTVWMPPSSALSHQPEVQQYEASAYERTNVLVTLHRTDSCEMGMPGHLRRVAGAVWNHFTDWMCPGRFGCNSHELLSGGCDEHCEGINQSFWTFFGSIP